MQVKDTVSIDLLWAIDNGKLMLRSFDGISSLVAWKYSRLNENRYIIETTYKKWSTLVGISKYYWPNEILILESTTNDNDNINVMNAFI